MSATWVSLTIPPHHIRINRCIPSFNDNFTSQVVNVVGSVASVVSPDVKNTFSNEFNSVSNIFTRYVGDIQRGILIIVACGLGVGFAVSMMWLVFLRYAAGLVVWLIILTVNALLIGFTLVSFR